MAIIPLAPDNFEVFTLELHPRKQYNSGSLGITGSVNLFSEQSTTQKLLESSDISFQLAGQGYNENKLVIELNGISEATAFSNNIEVGLESYLEQVNALPAPPRLSKTFDIVRERPAETYAEIVTGSIKKQQIKNVLFPNYRSTYSDYNYAYTNYHTLNFFTASDIPINSAILYPNSSSVASSTGRISGSYIPENKFTFEFFINPRYTTDEPHGNFKAGTVMHMSSTYAVSMVTGSSKDINGYPDGFRLVLQLSHSADVNPSAAIAGAYPNNLIFSSSDNSLKRNHWHHVAIRWGGNTINDGSGSFVIDGEQRGVFCIPSSSITPLSYDMSSAGNGNPSFLSIGNYYEGTNVGSEAQSLFFSSRISDSDGLLKLSDNTTVFQPNSRFNYPLNAEVHDLKIYSSYQTIDQIVTASKNGIEDLSSVLFYAPPFFTKESTRRDVLITPLTSSKGTTIDPFNTSLSFRNSGRDINLENFVRDFKTGNYPRLLNLTGSSATTFPLGSTFRANDILYTTLAGHSTRQGHTRKRNLTILPNDNGKFRPNFNLLKTGSIETVPKSGSLLDKYTNDLGVLDLSLISLRDMLHSGAIGQPKTTAKSSKGVYQLYGPGLGSGSVTLAGGIADMQSQPANHPVYSLFQLTGNSDSNEIVVFNISNTFFGNNIREGSFAIEDTSLKYSGDKVKIKLKDNGLGSLYRANSLTEHPTWSSVGNILYNEGAVVIKAPELSFFGEGGFSAQLSGSQNLHVLRVYTPAAAGLINSSSNISYIPVSSS